MAAHRSSLAPFRARTAGLRSSGCWCNHRGSFLSWICCLGSSFGSIEKALRPRSLCLAYWSSPCCSGSGPLWQGRWGPQRWCPWLRLCSYPLWRTRCLRAAACSGRRCRGYRGSAAGRRTLRRLNVTLFQFLCYLLFNRWCCYGSTGYCFVWRAHCQLGPT